MQFTIDRSTLLPAIQTVIGVVERRLTMPVLAHILIEAKDGQLRLSGTDLEIELVTTCPADIAQDGEATVPGRKLLDICRGLPDDAQISVKQEDNGGVHVQSGRSRFRLVSLPAWDWPKAEEFQQEKAITLASGELKRLIDRTHFAVAVEDVRYYLNGMLLRVSPDGVRCVATDGHRMAMADLTAPLSVDEPAQAIVPRKAIQQIKRLLADSELAVQLLLSRNHLQVTIDVVTLTTKLIDGRYPDYQRILDQQAHLHVRGDCKATRNAISRAAIFSKEALNGVRLALSSNQLLLTGENGEKEQCVDEIRVEYDGDPFEIGFNAGYLLDALSAIESDEFTLDLSGPDGSGFISPVGETATRYVVMPMRL